MVKIIWKKIFVEVNEILYSSLFPHEHWVETLFWRFIVKIKIMPPIEQVSEPQKDAASNKSVIGIIYPPPEIRSILYHCVQTSFEYPSAVTLAMRSQSLSQSPSLRKSPTTQQITLSPNLLETGAVSCGIIATTCKA